MFHVRGGGGGGANNMHPPKLGGGWGGGQTEQRSASFITPSGLIYRVFIISIFPPLSGQKI